MEDVTNMEVIRKFVDLAPHNPLASPFGRGVRRPKGRPSPKPPIGRPTGGAAGGGGEKFSCFFFLDVGTFGGWVTS